MLKIYLGGRRKRINTIKMWADPKKFWTVTRFRSKTPSVRIDLLQVAEVLRKGLRVLFCTDNCLQREEPGNRRIRFLPALLSALAVSRTARWSSFIFH